jgi:hypothetical protein
MAASRFKPFSVSYRQPIIPIGVFRRQVMDAVLPDG